MGEKKRNVMHIGKFESSIWEERERVLRMTSN